MVQKGSDLGRARLGLLVDARVQLAPAHLALPHGGRAVLRPRRRASHHLVSVVLHAVNSVLVFAWLRRATGSLWRSAVVGALFAVHPLHVESVAWISERKDVLSTFFWLVAMFAYLEWERHRDGRAVRASSSPPSSSDCSRSPWS